MATLEFLEGPMRNGKSLLANRRMFRALRDGAVCAVNYELRKDWAWDYAKRTTNPFASDQEILDKAISYWDRTFRVGSVESLEEFADSVKGAVVGKRAKLLEGKGIIVLDEAGLYYNSREWSNHMPFIQFLTRLGKYECIMYMISHSHQDIDVQIQRKIELVTSVRNMQRRKFMGFELELFFKKPKFRILSVIGGAGAGKGTTELKEWFGLDLKTCDMYDTFFMFDMKDSDRGLTKLGAHPEILFKEMKREEKLASFIQYSPASPWPRQIFYGGL